MRTRLLSAIAVLVGLHVGQRSIQAQDKDQPGPVPRPQGHPVYMVAVSGRPLPIELKDRVLSVMGRVQVWWQVQDQTTGGTHRLELAADNILVFMAEQAPQASGETGWMGDMGRQFSQDMIEGIYVAGDVVFSEGLRQIRCDQLYVDLRTNKALATNASLRTFDAVRQVPIYVRASRLRQVAADVFEAEEVVLTTSEFYRPQFSFTATKVVLMDETPPDLAGPDLKDRQFKVRMTDASVQFGRVPFLRWDSVETGLGQPDVPVKSVRVGNDTIWGTSLETDWNLTRVLGLPEIQGVNGVLSADWYSERGPGMGLGLDYDRQDYFGRVNAYAIYDTGTDTLGRIPARRDLEPPQHTRGRFTAQHRHFLPNDWQLTGELSYLSDLNFLEQYERNESNLGKPQETLIHLKRIQDNWGISFLGKSKINAFEAGVSEAPSAQFHWTGQSLWHDRLTLYSDSVVGRFYYRVAEDTPPVEPEGSFYLMTTRNELDLPVALRPFKVVPFVAGTAALDDGAGFHTNLDNQTVPSQRLAGLGEAGMRVSLNPIWAVYPAVQSRLWDLRQIRHLVRPSVMAVAYGATDQGIDQRDVVDLRLSQALQTKRGQAKEERVVDWLVWDLDFVWLDHSLDRPNVDYLLWNRPYVPLSDLWTGRLPPQDRRSTVYYGPVRNYLGSDVALRLTDSTAVLADVYFDWQDRAVRQANIGISHVRWPDLSYYVGSRYLRDFDNGLGQKGSNALTFAATYRLDERYAVVVAQQFDLEYGANIRSDLALVRKYHRLYYGLTFSIDESLDRTSVVFSLWPQGVSELGLGSSRYRDLGL